MTLYVPASTALADVKAESAIVGTPEHGGILCAYEGGVYSAMDFEEKLTIACWRLSERSPNRAYAWVEPEDIHAVATVAWDAVLRDWIVEATCDEPAFVAWFGENSQIGGSRAQHCRAASRIFNNSRNMSALMAYEGAIATQRDPVDALIAHERARS